MPLARRTAVAHLAALVAAPAVLRGRFRLFAGVEQDYSARAIRLVEETVVVDMLNQFRFADHADRPPKSERWLRRPGAFTREDFEPYRTSGIRVFALGHGVADYESALRWCAEWNGFLAAYDEWLLRVGRVADFERARRSGRVGVMLTLQTSDHFRTPDDVDTFWSLGQRVSQLTYNLQNRLGAGFLENADGGLTVFGERVVRRMNDVGMAVDVSHCADRTTLDAIAASTKPVLMTHGAARALLPGYLRCKTDEAIRLMARGGGVLGIAMLRFMVRDREPTTVEHVLDHVDHVARLVGVEHVGIGSDMDLVGNPNPVGGPGLADIQAQPHFERYGYRTGEDGRITIRGLDHPRRVYDLAEGLIRRRYADADIRAVLGGNFVRALGAIWPA